MSILIINAGSSSIKYSVFETETLKLIDHALIENVVTHLDGFDQLRTLLLLHHIDIRSIDAIGHRVVHGGESFIQPIRIDSDVLKEIKELNSLAPLHNPHNLEGIEAAQSISPDVPHFAVFDTAFHHTMPEYAYRYPLPHPLYHNHRIRKYGFHGTSHHYVALKAAELLNKPLGELNLITLHIGNGVSLCAIQNGISIDTSMGLTPLEGVMMGTRCGSIDPSIIRYLFTHTLMSMDEIDHMLNYDSGLKAITGTNDMRRVIDHAEQNDEDAILGINMFVYRLKMQLGAYIAVLGHVDGIVFTGGIGEHSSLIREQICEGLAFCGIEIDKEKNHRGCTSFEMAKSTIALLKIPTDEEYYIASQIRDLFRISA